MAHKFKVGDRVSCDGEVGTVIDLLGDKHTVVALDSCSCGVVLPQYPGKRVWWLHESCFKKLEVESRKILITTDGTSTTATLFDGKQKVKTAEAKCAPDDTFSFETSAKLAFDRLIGRDDKATPKKDKPSFDWDAFKAGKIAVHCDTVEKAKAFLRECRGKGNMKTQVFESSAGNVTKYVFSAYGTISGYIKDHGIPFVDYPFTAKKK